MSDRRKGQRIGTERIQLTSKQANIYVWGWQPDARFRFAVCGRRFGKTYLGVEEIKRAYRLAIERNCSLDDEIWYGAPTFKQAKRVFWGRLKRFFPADWIAGINNTEAVITTVSGHVIRIVGLDDPDALRGSGLWFFIGDEWDDAKAEVWSEVVRPMLATSTQRGGGHALFIGTPKGFGKMYDGYVAGQPGDKREPDVLSWKYNSIEGGNIPAEEVERARRTLDARTFRQEYEASFETFAGRIYYSFDRRFTVKARAYDPKLPVHIGMDFNINPMTATVWQETTGNDGGLVSWQIDEIVIPTADTAVMAAEVKNRYARESFDPANPKLDHITIYPDASGQARRTSAGGATDVSILREAGFSVVVAGQNPPVRDRINIVNGRLEAADGIRRAFIDPRCTKSIEAMERQLYKEGTSEPDKTTGHDHCNDATGYYMFARFGLGGVRGIRIGHMER